MVDSPDYFTNIVTPLEVELALVHGREWTGDYSTNFADVLPKGRLATTEEHKAKPLGVCSCAALCCARLPLRSLLISFLFPQEDEASGVRYSTITRKLERAIPTGAPTAQQDSKAVVPAAGELTVLTASDYMLARTFKGLSRFF